jgi:hypothetical protein
VMSICGRLPADGWRICLPIPKYYCRTRGKHRLIDGAVSGLLRIAGAVL